jgi:hypothetical protein
MLTMPGGQPSRLRKPACASCGNVLAMELIRGRRAVSIKAWDHRSFVGPRLGGIRCSGLAAAQYMSPLRFLACSARSSARSSV